MRAALALWLAAIFVAVAGPPLSGATILAGLLVLAGGGYVLYISWKEPHP